MIVSPNLLDPEAAVEAAAVEASVEAAVEDESVLPTIS